MTAPPPWREIQATARRTICLANSDRTESNHLRKTLAA
jgi:hypothetical protein